MVETPTRTKGHTVLAVPVPQLDQVVRSRTAHYDKTFVSTDPRFVHAHITVLAPWVVAPTQADLDLVGEIAAQVEPTLVTLSEVEEFVGGVIHLRPEPAEPFGKLTSALSERYPDHPPYAGEFPDPVPHLTLDHPAGGVTLDEVRDRMEALLPITFTLERLDLQWWANNDCRLLHSWAIGGVRRMGAASPRMAR